jgi:hypothetical protein
MPYIKQEDRAKFDVGLKALSKLTLLDLQAVFYLLCRNFFRIRGGRYAQINDVMGALLCCRAEWCGRHGVVDAWDDDVIVDDIIIDPPRRRALGRVLRSMPCPENAGELNFVLTMIGIGYVNSGAETRMAAILDVRDCLHACWRLFSRVVASPYEQTKIAENGDVY